MVGQPALDGEGWISQPTVVGGSTRPTKGWLKVGRRVGPTLPPLPGAQISTKSMIMPLKISAITLD